MPYSIHHCSLIALPNFRNLLKTFIVECRLYLFSDYMYNTINTILLWMCRNKILSIFLITLHFLLFICLLYQFTYYSINEVNNNIMNMKWNEKNYIYFQHRKQNKMKYFIICNTIDWFTVWDKKHCKHNTNKTNN